MTFRWKADSLDAALADGGLDQLVHGSSPDGLHASLRRLLCDVIEEYGRHTGTPISSERLWTVWSVRTLRLDGMPLPASADDRLFRWACFRAVRTAWIRVLIMGFWSRSTHLGGIHSGIPSVFIRQVQPRARKLWW